MLVERWKVVTNEVVVYTTMSMALNLSSRRSEVLNDYQKTQYEHCRGFCKSRLKLISENVTRGYRKLVETCFERIRLVYDDEKTE